MLFEYIRRVIATGAIVAVGVTAFAVAPISATDGPIGSGPFTAEPIVFTDCFGLEYLPFTAIYAQPGVTTWGTSGDDVIIGTSGDDVIIALGGNDRVCAGDGVDQVFGDELQTFQDTEGDVGGGIDFLDGEEGSDALWGGGGSDLIDGGKDGDVIWAGRGADVIYGQKGNDAIDCGLDFDYAFGGRGIDTAGPACDVFDPGPQ